LALHTYGDGGTSYSGFISLQPTSGYTWLGYFGQSGGGATVVETNIHAFQQNGISQVFQLNNGREPQRPDLPIGVKDAVDVPLPPKLASPVFMMRVPGGVRRRKFPLVATQGIPPQITQESPVPGGATCAGFAPTEADVPITQGGATASGNAPTEVVPASPELLNRDKELRFHFFGPAGLRKIKIGVPKQLAVALTQESPTPGGATCGGFGPVAQVPTVIGGAAVSGNAPIASVPVVIGATTAQGNAPVAATTTVPGGAIVAGQTGNAAATNIVQGGAVDSGNAPVPAGTSAAGGVAAQGQTGDTAATNLTQGGASTGGFQPNEVVPLSTQPSYTVQKFLMFGPAGFRKIKVGVQQQAIPVIDSPIPGGATTGGASPTANSGPNGILGGISLGGHLNQSSDNISVPAPQGGAVDAGQSPIASTNTVINGAVAQGTTGEAGATNITQGGATTGGFAPSEVIVQVTAVPRKLPSFLLAGPGGIRQLRRYRVVPIILPPDLLVPGGASTGGFGPTAKADATIGGAIVNGRAATSTSTCVPGGAVVVGQAPTGSTTLTRGAVTVNGRTLPGVQVNLFSWGIPATGRAPTEIIEVIASYLTAKGRIVGVNTARGKIVDTPAEGDIHESGAAKGRLK